MYRALSTWEDGGLVGLVVQHQNGTTDDDGGGGGGGGLKKSPSTVLEDEQDVLVGPIAAPSILKITEAGAAHPCDTHTHTHS